MRFRKKNIRPQAFPMPVWMQSFYAFLRIVLFTWIIIAVPLAVSLVASGHGYADWRRQLKLSGNIFLISYGVPLQMFEEQVSAGPVAPEAGMSVSDSFNNGAATPSTEAQFIPQGEFSLVPFLMIFIIIILAYRAGYSLACAATTRQLWQVVCSWSVCIAGIGMLISWFCDTETVRSSIVSAGLIPLLPTGCGLLGGIISSKKRWFWRSGHRAVHSNRGKNNAGGFPTYMASVIKGSGMSLLLVCCISAAILTVGLCLRWADIAGSFQRLDADWTGDMEFFMVQLAYLPNLVLMTASWLSGAGVHLGNDMALAPFQDSNVIIPPMVPILQAVPARGSLLLGIIASILFVLAGIAVGRWFWVHAENYSDETFDMRFKVRFISLILSSAVNAVIIATGAAAVLVFLGWLASGELGLSGVHYGGNLLWFGIYCAASISSGIFIGQLVIALREHYQLLPRKTGKA